MALVTQPIMGAGPWYKHPQPQPYPQQETIEAITQRPYDN